MSRSPSVLYRTEAYRRTLRPTDALGVRPLPSFTEIGRRAGLPLYCKCAAPRHAGRFCVDSPIDSSGAEPHLRRVNLQLARRIRVSAGPLLRSRKESMMKAYLWLGPLAVLLSVSGPMACGNSAGGGDGGSGDNGSVRRAAAQRGAPGTTTGGTAAAARERHQAPGAGAEVTPAARRAAAVAAAAAAIAAAPARSSSSRRGLPSQQQRLEQQRRPRRRSSSSSSRLDAAAAAAAAAAPAAAAAAPPSTRAADPSARVTRRFPPNRPSRPPVRR